MAEKWLEVKVDKINTDVVELKYKVQSMDEKLDDHMKEIKEHVAGDKKIIDRLMPVLDKLPIIVELAEERSFELKKRKEFKEKLSNYSLKLGIISVLVGIVVGIKEFLNL